MKRYIHITLSLLLATYVTVGTVGINVYKQTCRLFGKTNYSLFVDDDCCLKTKDQGNCQIPYATKIDDGFSCCDHDSYYAQTDFQSFEKTSWQTFLPAAIYTFTYEIKLLSANEAPIMRSDTRPPPLLWKYGTQLIAFVGQFLL